MIMRAHDEDNIDVNAFNTMKKELKELKDQTNHPLAKSEGITSNSAQVETLHDAIVGKNQLIKSLQETMENLKAQLMDR